MFMNLISNTLHGLVMDQICLSDNSVAPTGLACIIYILESYIGWGKLIDMSIDNNSGDRKTVLIGYQYMSLLGSRANLSVCYKVAMIPIHCVHWLTDSIFKTNVPSHAVKRRCSGGCSVCFVIMRLSLYTWALLMQMFLFHILYTKQSLQLFKNKLGLFTQNMKKDTGSVMGKNVS